MASSYMRSWCLHAPLPAWRARVRTTRAGREGRDDSAPVPSHQRACGCVRGCAARGSGWMPDCVRVREDRVRYATPRLESTRRTSSKWRIAALLSPICSAVCNRKGGGFLAPCEYERGHQNECACIFNRVETLADATPRLKRTPFVGAADLNS